MHPTIREGEWDSGRGGKCDKDLLLFAMFSGGKIINLRCVITRTLLLPHEMILKVCSGVEIIDTNSPFKFTVKPKASNSIDFVVETASSRVIKAEEMFPARRLEEGEAKFIIITDSRPFNSVETVDISLAGGLHL
jgi:hypothetical protein